MTVRLVNTDSPTNIRILDDQRMKKGYKTVTTSLWKKTVLGALQMSKRELTDTFRSFGIKAASSVAGRKSLQHQSAKPLKKERPRRSLP